MRARIAAIASTALLFTVTGTAIAKCDGTPFNPVTDIAWNGIFPIRVGGVPVAQNSNLPDGTSGTDSPVCVCTTDKETYLGLDVSFWEIAYLAESVKDAYCSPSLGTAFAGADNGFHGGTNERKTAAPYTFKQVHWLMFPAFHILGLLTDMQCLESGDFAYASMSEINPLHNNALLADLADPKALLFANPAADIACVASNSLAQLPGGFFPTGYDSLFWCWWENIYPLTGDMGTPHDLTATAQTVARQIFFLSETGLLQDHVKNVCAPTYTAIPKKSQWRFQLAKPVKSATPFVVGQTELVWGINKSQSYHDGNYLYVLFQKKRCCQKLKGSNSTGSN